jgi:ABC-type cobalamin/Fe3+-siderophores transport system ATPase subunit
MAHELQATDLVFGYEPGARVLDGVGTTVRSGALVSIVGPNGSGKSTLLRLLCGVLAPNLGSVSLDGKSLSAYSNRDRARRVAFLPQSVNPAFALTAFEVVALGRYPHVGALAGLSANDRSVVERCLADTETNDFAERDFNALSGGERQRVLLASILAQEPDLLLLDEPTSALDLHHQIEIFALLQRLTRQGYGVGVVTHDLNLAAQFCDELSLLTRGEGVLAQGPPRDVLTEPLLSEAYGSRIEVCEHPLTGCPLVSAVPAAEASV